MRWNREFKKKKKKKDLKYFGVMPRQEHKKIKWRYLSGNILS